MIRIPITEAEITKAKYIMNGFDQQKFYDKMECKTNWIGYLGELVFARFLCEKKIPHKWIRFVKDNYESEDYVINDKTIDLKTTHSQRMWIQKSVFDIYVFARVNKDVKELIVISYITGKDLQKLINGGKLEVVVRGYRRDFTVFIKQMKPIEKLFFEEFNVRCEL